MKWLLCLCLCSSLTFFINCTSNSKGSSNSNAPFGGPYGTGSSSGSSSGTSYVDYIHSTSDSKTITNGYFTLATTDSATSYSISYNVGTTAIIYTNSNTNFFGDCFSSTENNVSILDCDSGIASSDYPVTNFLFFSIYDYNSSTPKTYSNIYFEYSPNLESKASLNFYDSIYYYTANDPYNSKCSNSTTDCGLNYISECSVTVSTISSTSISGTFSCSKALLKTISSYTHQ